MKNTLLKTLLLSSLSFSSIFATGWDIEEKMDIYIGAGYSLLNSERSDDISTISNLDYNAMTFIAGFRDASKYWGAEFRYSQSFGSPSSNPLLSDNSLSNIAVYFKPQYEYNDVKAYGLIGYGSTTIKNDAASITFSDNGNSFQYGLGISYGITDNTDVFVDYIWVYDDTGFSDLDNNNNQSINGLTFGVTYSF